MATVQTSPGTKDRLYAMVQGLMKDSAIPAPFRPTVTGMIKGYFDKVDDSEIEKLVLELARDVVPYILGIDFETFIERLTYEHE
jgi:hypothetical protein